jgi:hypothetical protein
VKLVSLLMIAGLVMAGCCSTLTELQQSPTSDLQIRRYELKCCLSTKRMGWDKQPLQSSGYNEVQDDLEEKGAIEQEITRREVTNYRPSWITTGYVHDRCHCQCWVVTL